MMMRYLNNMSMFRTSRLIAAVALGAVGASACADKTPMHGVVIEDPAVAPPLVLVDANGKSFDLSKERGRAVLIYFGYTHCPDICPATLSDWARASRELGTASEKVRFVFVSVDPERDTPQVSYNYAHQFDAAFVGLTASDSALERIKKNWGFTVFREETGDPKGYGVAHPGQSFVIDANGMIRLIFPPATKPGDIAADLRRLM
jgi:protein SCO1/2